MSKTMHWRVLPGVVAVVVHTAESPSDQDWDAYLAEVLQYVHSLKGVLVYSHSVGPSAPQRARSNELFQSAKVDVCTVIMTSSRMVRGAVTALSWALGSKIKAVSTLEFAEAMTALGLDSEDQIKTKVALKQLARSANVQIDAFADESGQFRQKFGG